MPIKNYDYLTGEQKNEVIKHVHCVICNVKTGQKCRGFLELKIHNHRAKAYEKKFGELEWITPGVQESGDIEI